MSIEAAAREKQVDVEALMSELSRAIAERGGGHLEDPRALSTPRLVAHIVSKYHEALRRALPNVRGLAAKVAGVHGDRNPKLAELESLASEVSSQRAAKQRELENARRALREAEGGQS